MVILHSYEEAELYVRENHCYGCLSHWCEYSGKDCLSEIPSEVEGKLSQPEGLNSDELDQYMSSGTC